MSQNLIINRKDIDVSSICSEIYRSFKNYDYAVRAEGTKFPTRQDAGLIGIFRLCEIVGRQSIELSFEPDTPHKRVITVDDLAKLIFSLRDVIDRVIEYCDRNFKSLRWSSIETSGISPFAAIVFDTLRSELSDMVDETKQYGYCPEEMKKSKVLVNVLKKINEKFSENRNILTNEFNQYIKENYTANYNQLNKLLDRYTRLQVIRVFLPMFRNNGENKLIFIENLEQHIRNFKNKIRHKPKVFRGCIHKKNGKLLKWNGLVGTEFIFFFEFKNNGIDFYNKQQGILDYWYDCINLGKERLEENYSLQPYHAASCDGQTVLDSRHKNDLEDFVLKSVLPIKLAHLFYKNDLGF